MKIHLLTFLHWAFPVACLLGQTGSLNALNDEAYQTACFVVNHTPHPIHLAFYDAHKNLCARESDDLVLPGDSLGYGLWRNPQKFVDPLDSVDIVITSDKRKWVIRSVLMREAPSVQEVAPRLRAIYYFVEWSKTAYYR